LVDSEGEEVMSDELFEVVDSSGLTDADWAQINKLRAAYKTGGKKGVTSVAFCDRWQLVDFRYAPFATVFLSRCNMSRRA
jgi:hypothetical protein